MLVRPVVGRTAHGVGLVPREVLEDGVDGVAGEAPAALAELLPVHTSTRWQRRVGDRGRRPQQHAASGVEGVVAADVGAGDDRPHERVDLRLGQRVVAGAAYAGAPAGREVAVEVEPLRVVRAVGTVNPSWSTTVALVQQPVARRTAGAVPSIGTGTSSRASSGAASTHRSGRRSASCRTRPSPSTSSIVDARPPVGVGATATGGCSSGGSEAGRPAPTRRRRG